MIICICHRVSDRDISRAVREGCGSFEELQFELGVATGCGACGSCAQATFHELHGAAADMPADSGHGHSHAQGRGHAHSHTHSHAAPVRVLRRLTPAHLAGAAAATAAAAVAATAA